MKTVGILLDRSTFRGIPGGRTGYEQISLYNAAARSLRLTPIYMCLSGIRLSSRRAVGFVPVSSGYKKVSASLPKVIHNRSLPSSSAHKAKLSALARKALVFNRERYGKYTVQRKLARTEADWYLPSTRVFNAATLKYMTRRFNELYIKPNIGGVGVGIIKIGKIPGTTCWSIQRRSGKPKVVDQGALYRTLRRMTSGKRYIIQEKIHLATYKGNPYDIRVSVQKGEGGQWGVTGMVGKVAKKGSHVTNVARGGRVRRCELLFRHAGLDSQEVKRKIKTASLQIARLLGRKLPGVADLGLDVGVTSRGTPYLIEVNFRDQRYSFREAGLNREYFASYENPLKYARYLLRKR
ncbi:YheC/YheD family protein [Paenibacillus thermotolerans]|uniref:YheC/YheD family endospore coat-associated protein n=1 Tax=Paenibacillus thermotolerans TaxID=3027807 RepID=UPI002367A0AC|nr:MULTISPECIES: YheC/YheD family protein [unclassified Paenibacillus]